MYFAASALIGTSRRMSLSEVRRVAVIETVYSVVPSNSAIACTRMRSPLPARAVSHATAPAACCTMRGAAPVSAMTVPDASRMVNRTGAARTSRADGVRLVLLAEKNERMRVGNPSAPKFSVRPRSDTVFPTTRIGI